MPDTTRRCIFCGGGGPLSVEHVVPSWVPDLLEVTGQRHRLIGGRVVESGRRVAIKARAVCRACNNGWMAKLEGLMKARFGRLIAEAEASPISAVDQRLAAFWATKTLLLHLHAQPAPERRYDPSLGLRWLFDHRFDHELHPDWRVWTGRVNAEGWFIASERGEALAGDDPTKASGTMATLSVGNLMFHGFVWDIDADSDASRAEAVALLEMPPVFHRVLTQIWPVIDDPALFKPIAFTADGLRTLTDGTFG